MHAKFKLEAPLPAATTDLSALTSDQIDLVFPLAREADRDLSLDVWRHFAAPRAVCNTGERPFPGILLASRNNRIRGMAAYDLEGDAGTDRILSACHTIILDRTRERHIALDLLGGLLGIAEASHCHRLQIDLPPTSRWLHTRWSDPGGRVFRLPVECRAVPDRSPGPTRRATAGVLNFRPRPSAPAGG